MTYSDTLHTVPDTYWHEDERPGELEEWVGKVKLDLRAIRETAGLTTTQQAEAMGLSSYATVGQIERRKDWLVSQVARYVAAAGGTAALVVNVNGQQLEFTL